MSGYCNRCGADVRWVKRKRGWVSYELASDPKIHRCGQPKKRAITAFGGRTGPTDIPPHPPGVLPWEDAP